MTEVAESPLMSPEGRKAALDAYVSNCVRHGWRIESHTEFAASLAKGNRTNNVLHLILTIVTLGVWAIVWILVSIFGGEKRMAVRVDENGEVRRS